MAYICCRSYFEKTFCEVLSWETTLVYCAQFDFLECWTSLLVSGSSFKRGASVWHTKSRYFICIAHLGMNSVTPLPPTLSAASAFNWKGPWVAAGLFRGTFFSRLRVLTMFTNCKCQREDSPITRSMLVDFVGPGWGSLWDNTHIYACGAQVMSWSQVDLFWISHVSHVLST